MYVPKHFQINDQQEQIAFIRANGFGQLISLAQGRLHSTHAPFLLSDDETRLFVHIAKPNSQHLDLDGQEVLVSLQGAHDYISPTWYEAPGVPTWNYQALHIYGRAQTFNDPERLRRGVDALSHEYERHHENPWQINYNDAMLQAIIGIEIIISEIQCQYKLSQNRSKQDRAQVMEQLEAAGSTELLNAMRKSESNPDIKKKE